MDELKKLIEKRNALLDENDAMLDSFKADETRDAFTAEETAAIESRMAEIDNLNKQINLMEKMFEGAKSRQTRSKSETPEKKEASLSGYLRGEKTNSELRGMSIASDAAGGYFVEEEMAARYFKKKQDVSYFRQRATTIKLSGTTDVPLSLTSGKSEIVAEGGAFPEVDPTLGNKVFKASKLGRITKVSEELVEDSAFNIEEFLVDSFAEGDADGEREYFIKGTGSAQPEGILTAGTVAVTTAKKTEITYAELFKLFTALPTKYQANACFLMNKATLNVVGAINDGQGNPILKMGTVDGQRCWTLFETPVFTDENFDTVSQGKKAIAYADLSAYMIGDRAGFSVRRLDEIYSGNGQVGFRGMSRVDGHLMDAEACQILVMGAGA